jgi:hypothetical protein
MNEATPELPVQEQEVAEKRKERLQNRAVAGLVVAAAAGIGGFLVKHEVESKDYYQQRLAETSAPLLEGRPGPETVKQMLGSDEERRAAYTTLLGELESIAEEEGVNKTGALQVLLARRDAAWAKEVVASKSYLLSPEALAALGNQIQEKEGEEIKQVKLTFPAASSDKEAK